MYNSIKNNYYKKLYNKKIKEYIKKDLKILSNDSSLIENLFNFVKDIDFEDAKYKDDIKMEKQCKNQILFIKSNKKKIDLQISENKDISFTKNELEILSEINNYFFDINEMKKEYNSVMPFLIKTTKMKFNDKDFFEDGFKYTSIGQTLVKFVNDFKFYNTEYIVNANNKKINIDNKKLHICTSKDIKNMSNFILNDYKNILINMMMTGKNYDTISENLYYKTFMHTNKDDRATKDMKKNRNDMIVTAYNAFLEELYEISILFNIIFITHIDSFIKIINKYIN